MTRYSIVYERPDGTSGEMWQEDWLRIMRALYEASQAMYETQITDQRP